MDTTLLYNVPPPAGKLNGVFVTADSPGIPPFAFHAQHGSMKSDVTPDDVTGFAACTKAVSVRVRDARKETEAPTLDTHGFTLLTDARVDVATAHAELRDDAHVRSRYYTEMEALAKSAFPGASHAFAFNNVRRQSRQQEAPDAKRPRHAAGLSAPSYMVHSDCTHLSWQARLQELHREGTLGATASSELSAEQLEALASAKRLIVLNLWRLVANFSQPTPTHLAVCDVRSVDLTADVLPYRFCVDGCVGHNHGLAADSCSKHRWYYYPGLASHEVLAFKAFDSADAMAGGEPTWCFHAAVDEPDPPAECRPRESIEVRVVLAFVTLGGVGEAGN
jgi:hypothetical protein